MNRMPYYIYNVEPKLKYVEVEVQIKVVNVKRCVTINKNRGN